jgi:hypothetical protein
MVAVQQYLAARHIRVVRWEAEDPGTGPKILRRLAVVELPRVDVQLKPVVGSDGFYEAYLPVDLGLTEADLRQFVSAQTPEYEFVSWDETSGRLVLRTPPAPVAVAQVVRYVAPSPPARTVITAVSSPAAVAPAPPVTVQVYVQFATGTAAVDMQRVLAKFGLTAAGGQLAVGSFAPDKVNGLLQLISDEPSVQCASLAATPCSCQPDAGTVGGYIQQLSDCPHEFTDRRRWHFYDGCRLAVFG